MPMQFKCRDATPVRSKEWMSPIFVRAEDAAHPEMGGTVSLQKE